jgi:hypothetical protein
VTDWRFATSGIDDAKLSDRRRRNKACFRLSRACRSPLSPHSSVASFSREQGTPGETARYPRRAQSFRPDSSMRWSAPHRTEKPPNSEISKSATVDVPDPIG